MPIVIPSIATAIVAVKRSRERGIPAKEIPGGNMTPLGAPAEANYRGPGNAGGQANARESQTATQSGRLMEARKALHESISALESRISGILRSAPPSPSSSGDKAVPVLVPWAEFLRECADDVNMANSRIMDMLNRMEV